MIRAAQVVRRFAFEEWGGTETVVWNTARSLREFGVDSEIVATRACSAAGNEVREGVEIRRFDYCYPNFPLSAEAKLALDKKGGNPLSFGLRSHLFTGEFDLFHLHGPGRIGQMTREAALRRRKPYLISFHGGCFDVPRSEIEGMMRPLRRTFPWGGVFDRLAGYRADLIADAAAVICVGANEVPELEKRYPGKRILHLPNGVDPSRFRRRTELDVRARFGIPKERKLLLGVSRIDAQKNQKQLLRLLAELNGRGVPSHLLLIGPVSSPDYFRELESLARELGMTGFLTVVKGVEQDDPLLPSAYAQSDVFLLPSRHEPFGIVVLEAWSAGLPVIASSVGGLRYLIKDGETGLLTAPDDTVAQFEAVRRLEERSFREQLVSAAGAEVEKYTQSAIAHRTAELYSEVLSECR